ncbi:MAG: hypothetical protein IPK06_03050 [Ignavibacteriae bacterium]|nr:hypothetical protein [Ignavibacteriota bacterium]
MKKELSKEDWQNAKKILFTLYELTWDYSELKARSTLQYLEDSKPQRFEKEPFRNYNQRLLNWDNSKSELYSKTFNEIKAKSFSLIKELEDYLIKLGLTDNKE